MTDITLEQRAAALVAKWRAIADGLDTLGGDISMAEAASMRNDANELEAALRLSAGADWQPIETAPTDQMILGWNKWETAVYEAETMVIRGGPVTVWRVPGDHEDAYDSPTHWQPLPAAPRHEPGEG